MKAGAGFYCSISSLLCCHACGLCSASSTIRPSNAVIEYYVEVKWKPCMSFGKVLKYNLGTFISIKSRLFNVGFIMKKVRAPNVPYLIQDLFIKNAEVQCTIYLTVLRKLKAEKIDNIFKSYWLTYKNLPHKLSLNHFNDRLSTDFKRELINSCTSSVCPFSSTVLLLFVVFVSSSGIDCKFNGQDPFFMPSFKVWISASRADNLFSTLKKKIIIQYSESLLCQLILKKGSLFTTYQFLPCSNFQTCSLMLEFSFSNTEILSCSCFSSRSSNNFSSSSSPSLA